jgi:hypothetical protein
MANPPTPTPSTAAKARAQAVFEADLADLKARIEAGEQRDVNAMSPRFLAAVVAVAIALGFVVGIALRMVFA